jgi:hypothetical protein
MPSGRRNPFATATTAAGKAAAAANPFATAGASPSPVRGKAEAESEVQAAEAVDQAETPHAARTAIKQFLESLGPGAMIGEERSTGKASEKDELPRLHPRNLNRSFERVASGTSSRLETVLESTTTEEAEEAELQVVDKADQQDEKKYSVAALLLRQSSTDSICDDTGIKADEDEDLDQYLFDDFDEDDEDEASATALPSVSKLDVLLAEAKKATSGFRSQQQQVCSGDQQGDNAVEQDDKGEDPLLDCSACSDTSLFDLALSVSKHEQQQPLRLVKYTQ